VKAGHITQDQANKIKRMAKAKAKGK